MSIRHVHISVGTRSARIGTISSQAYKGPIIYKMVDMDVDTDGKLGCVHVIEHVAGTDKEGKKKELNLRVTEIYRKINGKWQIVHEHACVPVDLKTDKADILSSK